MADIFHEVDDEVRRERLQKLWDRYNIYIIGLAVLIVAAVGAWRGYEWWMAKQTTAAGAKFEAAMMLSEQGKHQQAEKAFAQIVAQAPAGYRVLARFRAAAELEHLKPADAVQAYDRLAADTSLSHTLRDLAALRAGMLMVNDASLADMKKRLGPLANSDRAFRASAREMLTLSAWHHRDFKMARHYIDMLMGDAETPPALRGRAQLLSALIAGSGKS